ncbi:MAG: ATPase, partial [Chlamydiia bacterium]
SEGIEKGMQKGLAEGIEKGIQKGLAEGIEKGIQKGLAEGMEKGKEEGVRKNQIETGRSMLQEKLPLSVVVKITGLTLEEVKGIEDSIKKTL